MEGAGIEKGTRTYGSAGCHKGHIRGGGGKLQSLVLWMFSIPLLQRGVQNLRLGRAMWTTKGSNTT